MKKEKQYRRYPDIGKEELWDFCASQGRPYGFVFDDGYRREDALELINIWNRHLTLVGNPTGRYQLTSSAQQR